jgi:hypothetical protein
MSYCIQLNGEMELEHSLDIDKDISFVVKRASLQNFVVKPKSVDGEDEKTVYKYKSVEEVTIIQEEKIIISKPKKGSQSQVLQFKIKQYYQQQLSGGEDYQDDNAYYISEMNKLIEEWDNKLV